MKTLIQTWKRTCVTICTAACLAQLVETESVAATVTLNVSDATFTSSITGSTNWNPEGAPTAGNDYFNVVTTATKNLRTPSTGNAYIFAGDSLTFDSTGRTAGFATLSLKNNANIVQSLSANLFFLGMFNRIDGQSEGANYTLNGSINIAAGSRVDIFGTAGSATAFFTNTINSVLSGDGILGINRGASTLAANVILASDNNSLFTGTISVASSATTRLILEGGSLNNYIGDAAKLTLSSSTVANQVLLNFSGIDYLSGISFDGGTTYNTTPGATFGALGSGATVESSVFTGTGLLGIASVPEPSALSLVGLSFVLFLRRRR